MLKEKVEKVLKRIENGNNLGEKITLVGATKTISVDVINQAIEYGLNVVAENKVQEFRDKTDLIRGASQHFIGHLQTNKVKYLVGNVDLIHSVDSIHLAEEINRQALKKGVIQDILIEINVGGELSKSGFSLQTAKENIDKIIVQFPQVKIRGLMAMLPHTEDKTLLVDLFKAMRSLYDDLNKQGYSLTYLSMGMSSDYELAIENGSNMIRLGRTIFGERIYGVN